jgi:hypothetical protein
MIHLIFLISMISSCWIFGTAVYSARGNQGHHVNQVNQGSDRIPAPASKYFLATTEEFFAIITA